MMMIPFKVSADEYSVFVILEPENLARMKANDPAQLSLWKMPNEYAGLRLRTVILTTPCAEDVAKALVLVRANKPQEAFELLSRGFQYKPKEGDNDLPYQASRQQ